MNLINDKIIPQLKLVSVINQVIQNNWFIFEQIFYVYVKFVHV